jgi:hypothetical protein
MNTKAYELALPDMFIIWYKKRVHPIEVLKGLSYEIDFENVTENLQILAFTRAAAGL